MEESKLDDRLEIHPLDLCGGLVRIKGTDLGLQLGEWCAFKRRTGEIPDELVEEIISAAQGLYYASNAQGYRAAWCCGGRYLEIAERNWRQTHKSKVEHDISLSKRKYYQSKDSKGRK